MSLHEFDLTEQLAELESNVEKTKELHKDVSKLKDEIIKAKEEHYKLLCHGILKLYWYAVQGDSENFNALFQKLVNIAQEGAE